MTENKSILHNLREPMDGENWCMYILYSSLQNRGSERNYIPSMNLRAVPSQTKVLFKPAEALYREVGAN